MATSSIFHNVKIDSPEQAEAFVSALEASENDPWVRVTGSQRHTVNTDMELSKRLMKMCLNKESKN